MLHHILFASLRSPLLFFPEQIVEFLQVKAAAGSTIIFFDTDSNHKGLEELHWNSVVAILPLFASNCNGAQGALKTMLD